LSYLAGLTLPPFSFSLLALVKARVDFYKILRVSHQFDYDPHLRFIKREAILIDYTNKSVVVIGAASAIGAALAAALSKRGAYVICVDVNEEGLNHTLGSLDGEGEKIVCDLSKPEAALMLVNEAFDNRGEIGLICSNAGIGHRAKITNPQLDYGQIDRLFEINFHAGLKIAGAYANKLDEIDAQGRILFTASETSLSLPSAIRKNQVPYYSASKLQRE
jgi:NAD(P)-dependent dehydrogenase (short-subunit alcohol dehydrogenase family)